MRTKWKMILPCILVILTYLYSVQFYKINRQYPFSQLVTYTKDQIVSFNGFNLRILGTKFLDESDLKKSDKGLYDSIYIKDEEIKAIVVDIQITNMNQQDAVIDISDAWLQSNYWVNGIVMNGFVAINPGDASLHPNLGPGETVTLKLPFTMIPAHFKGKDWDNVQSRKYSLVLSFYPVKRMLEIN